MQRLSIPTIDMDLVSRNAVGSTIESETVFTRKKMTVFYTSWRARQPWGRMCSPERRSGNQKSWMRFSDNQGDFKLGDVAHCWWLVLGTSGQYQGGNWSWEAVATQWLLGDRCISKWVACAPLSCAATFEPPDTGKRVLLDISQLTNAKQHAH